MAASAKIPRFLLPQLSWKAATASCSNRPFSHVPTTGTKNVLHGRISSTSQAWQRKNVGSSLLCSPRKDLCAPCSSAPCCHETARGFSMTHVLLRDHHFDTLKFVQRLKDEGFSEEQSKAMMLVLSDVIEESIQNLTRTMVLREGNPSMLPGHRSPYSSFDRCRPEHLHPEGRFYKASLRAPRPRLQRHLHDPCFARASVK